MESWTIFIAAALLVYMTVGVANAQGLQYGYYSTRCLGIDVEDRVRTLVRRSFLTDATASAAMLRLAFHDCQVGSCDGSIMITGSGSEMDSGNNFGVKRLDIIDSVKNDLEGTCPNTVSCADIIAMAGRDAVAYNGGPAINIPLGRKDADFSSAAQADIKLPPASSNVDRMLSVFAGFGMTTAESVAILGAHTLGVGHCRSIQDRLQGAGPDSLVFNAQLRTTCAVNVFNINVIPNDSTQFTFDNQYFIDLQNGRGLFTVDADVSSDPRTAPIVATFANDQGAFFNAFASAYVKMTARALTGNQGSVRSTCQL